MPRSLEKHHQAAVEELLRLRGWKYMHIWNAQHSSGGGWPDIFAVRGTRAIALEIKTERGRVSKAQAEWIAALQLAGIEAMIVRLPSGWATIERVLR